MKNAEATAEHSRVPKYTCVWNSVTCPKRCANGTVNRNANSTWTPGNATRSSCRSSLMLRSYFSSGVSSRPLCTAFRDEYPGLRCFELLHRGFELARRHRALEALDDAPVT